MIRSICLLLFMLFVNIMSTGAQDLVLKDSSVTMPTGPQYKASAWKQIWWGKHYRKEWLTPASFPVIDLDATAGGLTPTKRGGGHQSKSLRLMGANGREYVLRSIDKTLDLLIPENFRGTYIHDIVNDQISTAHPYGPTAIAKLADAAGIYHTNPAIVFVPANNRLGEFSPDFANTLCLFEERASGKGWENSPMTGYADDIINAESMQKKISDDNDKSVDQKALLRVRIFDMWINDWDRHEDQFVWLAHKKDGKTKYTAFARDRDQAFSKTDGVNLYFLSRPWMLQSLQNLDSRVKNVIGTALAGRFLDKKFLNELTKEDWKETIRSLQSSLTDKAIREGIQSFPEPIFKISGEEIIRKLISRRNDMMRFGMKYYGIINKDVYIVGSEKKEQFTINRSSADVTEVCVKKINKNNELKDTIFYRVFRNNETKRLYLYGLDGDDIFTTTGKSSNRMKITIIGGSGNDEFTSMEKGRTGRKIKVYDDPSNHTKAAPGYCTHLMNDTIYTVYNRKRFQFDWYKPEIIPGYNPDDGIFLGAGFTYRKLRWVKSPYAWEQSFGGSVAFKTGATNFFYHGRFTRAIGKWDLLLDAAYKGPLYVFNYYGYGNETPLGTYGREYNRVRVKQVTFAPGMARKFRNQEIRLGLLAENMKVEANPFKFITGPYSDVNNIVFANNLFVGANLQYMIGKQNSRTYPSKGYQFLSSFTYKRNVSRGEKDFLNIDASAKIFLPLGKIIFAHRTGAATNIGDYEFYHANTLGGSENLRGYYRTRFTGQTAFYQNTELRWAFAKVNGYVLNGKIGIYGFFDDGRVWVKHDQSSKFHIGYGGGVFFLPYNLAAINISYGNSDESGILKFGLHFFF